MLLSFDGIFIVMSENCPNFEGVAMDGDKAVIPSSLSMIMEA